MFKQLKPFFKKRFNLFLQKRIPAAAKQNLSNKNIFILPTKFGLAYLLSVFILFLLGTNYQNNLIILMSYLFASVFLTTMLYSFLNMFGLQFFFKSQVSAHATQIVSVPLTIMSNKPRFHINFSFDNNQQATEMAIKKGESATNIPFHALKRGINNPGRLKILSEYPLGLFICWTHLDFDCEVVTYPAKNTFHHIKQNSSQEHEEINGNKIIEGGDDFGELREYKQGESNAKIAWKQLARGQGWLTKVSQTEIGSQVWLSLKQLPSATLETKLEMLCFLMLEHYKNNVPFGLDLNTIQISPSTGNKHINKCLMALTFYGKPQHSVALSALNSHAGSEVALNV